MTAARLRFRPIIMTSIYVRAARLGKLDRATAAETHDKPSTTT